MPTTMQMSWQIDLLRHGAVEGAAALNGRSDPPLSVAGWAAFEPLFMLDSAPWQRIITSPRQRCRAVAERLADHYQLPLEINAGWAEMDFGQFDGIPFDKLQDQWPQLEQFWQDPLAHPLPDAESLAHFHQRIVTTWQSLIAQPAQESLLVVAHAGVIRQLLAHLLLCDWQQGVFHQRLRIPHASLTRIRLWPGQPVPFVQVEQIGHEININKIK